MKRISNALLVIVVLLLSVSCASLGQKEAKFTVIALDAPETAGDIATVPQLASSDIIRQAFNAVEWWGGYSIKTIVEEDFWFQPEPTALCATGTFDDTYLDMANYSEKENAKSKLFTEKYIAFRKDTNGKYEYDICVGEGQAASSQCYYQCFSSIGSELLVYVPYDYPLSKIALEPISNEKQMLDAENYIVTDAEGKTYVLSKADVAESTVLFDLNTVNIQTPAGLIQNAYSVVPEGVTPETTPVEGKIMRAVFALCAKSVYGKQPNAVGNVKGSYYNAIQIGTLLAQYGAKAPVSAQYNGSDYEVARVLEDRLIHHKSNGFMALRPYQLKSNTDDAVNVASITFDSAAIVFLTDAASTVESLNAAVADAKVAQIEYLDGSVVDVPVADALATELVAGCGIAAVKFF